MTFKVAAYLFITPLERSPYMANNVVWTGRHISLVFTYILRSRFIYGVYGEVVV